MTEAAVVRVCVRPENDGFAAHSPDVFGLNLWAASIDALRDRIRDGIKLLYRVNHGVNVEVTLARAPDFGVPPLRVDTPSNFVVARAA